FLLPEHGHVSGLAGPRSQAPPRLCCPNALTSAAPGTRILFIRSRQMTLGEERVRVSFNPSGDSAVEEIKQLTAALIDKCGEARGLGTVPTEEARLWSLAMTAYEEAAMWAVKAATIQK